jgi:hypothetical protein
MKIPEIPNKYTDVFIAITYLFSKVRRRALFVFIWPMWLCVNRNTHKAIISPSSSQLYIQYK